MATLHEKYFKINVSFSKLKAYFKTILYFQDFRLNVRVKNVTTSSFTVIWNIVVVFHSTPPYRVYVGKEDDQSCQVGVVTNPPVMKAFIYLHCFRHKYLRNDTLVAITDLLDILKTKIKL